MTAISLKKLLPFLEWLPFTGGQMRVDLIAGITVALVLVPQSMAYAQLAGLPAYYGLYAAFLPVIIGALWGSSRQLATGPVAVVALLTASALAPLAAGPEHYLTLAILLALMVGVVQFSLGVFRLGAIVNLLSHPVIIGFTNAAAIIIGLSQLNKLLGVSMGRSDNFLNDIYGVLLQVGDTHLPTLAMGLGALAGMFLLKRFLPKLPNVLIVVAATTLVSWQIGFEQNAKATHEEIADPTVAGLIVGFINGAANIHSLKEVQAARSVELRTLVKDKDVAGVAESEYQSELIKLAISNLESENKLRMASLRKFKFVRGTNPETQAPLLYLRNQAPQGGTEDTVWRIVRIGKDGQLHLSGGGEVVGAIPSGLPEFKWPTVTWSDMTHLLSVAVVIALVAFMEAISIAKAMAARTRSRIDPDRELIGQGLANVASAFSQGFPVSGSFSRSAVNLNAGAVTGLASVISGLLVLLTLLFLTGLLYHLPQAVLAAVIMMAVAGLVNFGAIRHAWQTHRHDGLAATISFVATLAFAPHLDLGILTGAVVAITLFLHRRMRPRGEIVGLHPDGVLAGLDTHNLKPISEKFVPVRFDGELTFVNVAYFEDIVLETLVRFPNAQAILLIGSSINEIDVSGEEKLREIAKRLDQMGISLYVSGLKRQVMEVLERAHIHETLPAERFFRSKEQALRDLLAKYDPAVTPPNN
ncbi:MAG: SulP family inorganic anion transporter [Rhodocyclaceae bacterium]|nr:SulP family inorganic anion transporter [Rhodocyclaceae bacterium]MDZ4214061.1 SulP family inorganic anion transporter [Rhodocyclaceae bacterium]